MHFLFSTDTSHALYCNQVKNAESESNQIHADVLLASVTESTVSRGWLMDRTAFSISFVSFIPVDRTIKTKHIGPFAPAAPSRVYYKDRKYSEA